MALKILVVEDDPLVLLMATDTLRAAGFSVVEAETAEAGLQELERDAGAIAAVFSDIETPGRLNGLVLASETVERWPTIPVVLTSGHVFPEREALPKAVRFIGKPYDLDAVAELLTNLTSV